jgi:hypothetical protein
LQYMAYLGSTIVFFSQIPNKDIGVATIVPRPLKGVIFTFN